MPNVLAGPRWQKLRRDLWASKGRTATMTIAVALGIFAVGTMLSAYAILTREIERNYRETNPASATLELDSVSAALLEEVRMRPGVAAAEARATLSGRALVGADWVALRLFVIKDFTAFRIGTFRPVGGAWPPPEGTMLLERTGPSVLMAGIGDVVTVRTAHGQPTAVPVSGLVHDPGLAPGGMEQTAYAYVTPQTLARLGESSTLNELRVIFSDRAATIQAIDAAARNLAGWLEERGSRVHEIQVPPPGRHPHQSQMTGILYMLIAFGGMALVLGAILVATMIASLMSRQIREIGIMKAIGARSVQIGTLYMAMVLLFGVLALALGVPAGLLGARAFANFVAADLNFTIGSYAIPWWVFAVEVVAGLLVPVLVAAVPLTRGSRVTVRRAIDDAGVNQETFGRRRLDTLLTRLPALDRSLLLAVRNTFRRRARLALTLGLLAAGGAMFMTARNVAEGWDRITASISETRHYDIDIRLTRAEPVAPLATRLRDIPGVRTVEAWGFTTTALATPGEIDLVRTYPDGGHGSFLMEGPPATTTMISYPVLSGRWLAPGDSDAVVVNQMALGQAPALRVDDPITLSLDGRPTTWRVVGIVEEVGSPATAYVTDQAFARVSGTAGRARMFRIATSAQDPAERVAMIRSIEQALQAEGVSVASAMPVAVLETAMGEHIAVLINTLLATAVLLALVGALGLMSTMSMNVSERTRELGVMQSVGATPSDVLRVVAGEGFLIGVLSVVVAVLVSAPLSARVAAVVGALSFRTPLPLVMSPLAIVSWFVIVGVGSVLASGYPAWRASRLTVREILAYQ